ncbi:MAG: single-stranded DNA-binding protein [Pedobacter sp.]|nr:single-stranded DNA-binding protein [Pedobacter sp.]
MENVNNKVFLSGFAGADPEVTTIYDNLRLARVNLAVIEHYRNALNEEVKKTQWFTITFWNAKADLVEAKIKKGSRLSIKGRLQTNHYEGKDGIKRYAVEIVANDIEYL